MTNFASLNVVRTYVGADKMNFTRKIGLFFSCTVLLAAAIFYLQTLELTVLIHLGIKSKVDEVTTTESVEKSESRKIAVACTYSEDCEVLRLSFEHSQSFSLVDSFSAKITTSFQVIFNHTVLNHIRQDNQKLVYVISDPRQFAVENETSISSYCDEIRQNIDFLYDNDLWIYGQNLKVVRFEDLQFQFDNLLAFLEYQGSDLKLEQVSRQSWRELEFETIHQVWLRKDRQ